MTVPLAGRLPQTNGRSQLTQFIDFRNTLTPAKWRGWTFEVGEVVLKRESEVDVRGLARSPFCRCVSGTQQNESDL